ncbi:MAG: TraR/DksA family transcriptional regulator [Acidimicrobiia bacterium]|nr:TraR/DksA family transcriptional regulator [Acidimicrobiia bacterium]
MTINIDNARKVLLEEQAKLIKQLHELGSDENGDLRSDLDFGEGFADAAAVTSERTEVLGIVETLKHQLDDVKEAVTKLDDGSYGTCLSCGKEIGAARMEARPFSLMCVDCKTRRSA